MMSVCSDNVQSKMPQLSVYINSTLPILQLFVMVAQNVKEGLWKAEQSGGTIQLQHSQVRLTVHTCVMHAYTAVELGGQGISA